MSGDWSSTLIEAQTQYDAAAKRLLAQKSILSRILSATVEELKDIPPETVEELIEGDIHIGSVPVDPGLTNGEQVSVNGARVVGLNTVQEEQREGYVTFDIVFYVRLKDGLSQIIINLEAQKDDPSGYDILNRAIFYVSRLVSSQKQRDFTGSRYNDLKRVYSIWICMNMDECVWNHIHLTDDAILSNHHWKGKLDLLNIVLLGLPNQLPAQGEKYELHRLLGALFASELTANERIDILEREYRIAGKPNLREELDTMCNLGQGVFERGIGQGIERGVVKEKQNTAQKLHGRGMSVPDIADFLEVDQEQVQAWLDGMPS